ncbi:hypothetical protein N878_20795, partial [Pseudomonas sp. EGD-AK9]|uniref:HAD-IC family P-type ATPase n=1 Tax=Pseudomonas sp. EGD-AK9 TaxID=1386078 RepID=UPI0003974BD7
MDTRLPEHSDNAWHELTPQQALEAQRSSSSGLEQCEATTRLQLHGPNRLPPPKRRGPLLRLLYQFHNVLLYMMMAAALITALLGHWVDTGVILAAVLINVVIGFIQEGKAENALDAIRNLLSPRALVLRGGERLEIDAEQLVPGDIVLLASGDKVPADLRLLSVKNLLVEEAALTGESLPVEKSLARCQADATLGDRRCMAYSGTLVASGQASGLVVATGAATELGRIGAMLQQVQAMTTPLLRQIEQFSRWLALAILIFALATFALGTFWHDQDPAEMFMMVVALTAAAIPEGLPALMTVILALGVQRMAGRNAIVRHLPAVETLGSVTLICSDKTGTLTRNEMTVQRVVSASRILDVSGVGYAPQGAFHLDGALMEPDAALLEIARAAALCNDAQLQQDAGGTWRLQGDPTEGALHTLALKAGLDAATLHAQLPRSDAIPFESEHRFMASLHHDHQGHGLIYLKGAPERVLEMCREQRGADGGSQPLDAD